MIALLRSELRKLLTVRSTYFVSLLALLLSGGLMAFYVEGFWGGSGSAAGALTDRAYTEIMINAFSTVSIFVAIIAMLQVVHEYRHNLITYTLSASNSRTKAFFAKLGVLALYAIVFSVVAAFVSLGLYLLGVGLRGGNLPAQSIDWLAVLGQGVFLNLGYMVVGAVVAYLSRNIALAIAVVLVVPSTIESLLTLLLKENAKYLPFTILGQFSVADPSMLGMTVLPRATAFLLLSGYLAAGIAITWYLFLRRDAN